jgi:DNA helicase-2/ATP-dependent DNA helicase PcrA
LLNPDNDLELLEVINYPKRGIGDSTINKCRAYADENNISLLEALIDCKKYLPAGAANKIGLFLDIYNDLLEKKDLYDVGAFISCLIEDTGLEEFFSDEKDPDSVNRLENIQEFAEIAWEFQMSGGTLEEFLENIMINQQEFEKKKESDTKKVQLMTVHSSKGLEFPVVFLIGVEDNLLPYSKSKEEIDGIEEERRLCYVAITRAKERLYVSRVIERSYYGEKRYNEPSIFVYEMGLEDKENKKGFNPFKQEV